MLILYVLNISYMNDDQKIREFALEITNMKLAESYEKWEKER